MLTLMLASRTQSMLAAILIPVESGMTNNAMLARIAPTKK